ESEFLLLPGVEILHRHAALLQFRVPHEDGEAGADRVRVVQVLRRPASEEVNVGGYARPPERLEDLEGLRLHRLPDWDHIAIEAGDRELHALRFRREDDPVESE